MVRLLWDEHLWAEIKESARASSSSFMTNINNNNNNQMIVVFRMVPDPTVIKRPNKSMHKTKTDNNNNKLARNLISKYV
jgi:hypothetical protein